MKHITATHFKQHCLGLLERMAPDGLVITKHGRPVARVTPIRKPAGDLIGSLRGKITVHGDIFSTGLRWHAEP